MFGPSFKALVDHGSEYTKRETAEREKVALCELCTAIVDAIKSHGTEGIPSGHLYAGLMGSMSLETYTTIINTLGKLGMIREKGNVFYAV